MTDEHSLVLYFKDKFGVIKAYSEQNTLIVIGTCSLAFFVMKLFMFPGAAIIVTFCGALFPFWLMLPCVALSSTLGTFLVHLYLESLPKDKLEMAWNKYAGKMQNLTTQHPFKVIVVCRISPVMPEVGTNLLLAIIKPPLKTVFAATLVGMLPYHVLYLLLGKGLIKLI